MLAEADMSLTSLAMGVNDAKSRHSGDDQLLVKFFLHPKQDAQASHEQGRPIFREVEYIEIRQPGNKDSVVARPATDMDRARFPEHYRKWKARSDDSDTPVGTLLEHWPAVTRSQVEELRYMNVRTVEQLAGMSDANAQGMMGIYQLKERAKAYLEASEKQAAADEITQLRRHNEELSAALQAMNKRLDALEPGGDSDYKADDVPALAPAPAAKAEPPEATLSPEEAPKPTGRRRRRAPAAE